MEKTIKITEEAHTALMERGIKGDTFNDIILKLCNKEGDINGKNKEVISSK